MRYRIVLAMALVSVALLVCRRTSPIAFGAPDEVTAVAAHPLAHDERARMAAEFDQGIAEQSAKLDEKPNDIAALSKRGDWNFFTGKFKNALADYERMCEVNPASRQAHWRLGLAYFSADQFETSATFFDKFFEIDDVDREGGLWKYLAQAKADGVEKARAGLLKYTKSDRPAMLAVYRMFEGQITPDELLKSILDDTKLSEAEREQRLFYVELYIGLWYDAHKQPKSALPHLRAATANKWPRSAGFGPNWMWHVARLHYERLLSK